MAITLPYSLALTKDEDAKNATPGTSGAIVAGKLVIAINTGAEPAKVQAIVGSLRSCYRRLIETVRHNTANNAVVAYGPWDDAVAGNILIAPTDSSTAGHVVVSMAADFATAGATHFVDETFKQLINVLLEKTADN